MATPDAHTDLAYERVVCAVLLDATKTLPRHRQRTRLSVCEEALRRWRDERGDAPGDDELNAAFQAVMDRLVEAGLAKVGGPSNKRVQLNHRGKEHAAKLLRAK